MRRFEHIAHDLEKLPCELHEPVLVDLEFEQLIRLSHFAGPRLMWSLENSPSPWHIFFQGGAAASWQKHLAVTDRVKTLCFEPPDVKGGQPDAFETGAVSFLHHQSSDWKAQKSYASKMLLSGNKLGHHWRRFLYSVVMDTMRSTYHDDKNYAKFVQPWEATLEHASKLPDGSSPMAVIIQVKSLKGLGRDVESSTIEQIANFIDLHQLLRRTVADAMEAELLRLASLYDKHPTRLKQAFAPQIQRRNKKHVSWVLRCVAPKIINTAENLRWNTRKSYASRFRYEFPALVPYDWCMQLFVKILQDQTLLESKAPAEVLDKCRMVLQTPPRWAVAGPEVTSSQNEKNPTAEVMRQFGQLGLHSQPLLRTQLLLENEGDLYCTHSESDMQWLETFVDVIAWMEETFPDVLLEVRGTAWDEIPERPRKEKA